MLEQRYSDNDQSRRDIPSFIEPRPPLIQNPFMRPRPQKGTNLLELFEEDSEIEEPELVQVYLRVKPCDIKSNLYEIRSEKCLVTTLDTTTAGHGRRTQHNLSKMYTFSKIFGPDSSQREVFEHVVKDNLKKLPEGHSFTLLTYGASGSGKTYTLMGTVSSPGLVPRSLEYVFKLVDAAQQPMYKPSDAGAVKLDYEHQEFELQWVKRLRHISAPLRDKYRRMSAQLRNDLTESNFDLANRTKYYVWVSFVEIYNEAVYDLLAPPDKRVKLRIREDTTGNVYVKGATQAFVRSGEEAYDVMVAGKHNLVVAATGVHAQSSRSHCIFTITMLTETEGSARASCVRLCDLAGSERARATRNTGARMQESRNINASLHVLERCLQLLRRNQRQRASARVPYRESKLTRLLGSGLSGSRGEAVSMVVTLNPSPQYAHETKHVLSLAAVAQDIQINNTMFTTTLETTESQDSTICSSAEIMKLRADNELLHFELVQAQARNKELMAAMEEKQEEAAITMRELVEEAKDMTKQYYEAQLQALRSEMDDMVEEYECRLSKMAAPPPSTGTPTRYLHNKISQLMTEIAVLEEKLSAERLARARAEKEVQHLRSCIEERDEKAYKETSPIPTPDNEVLLTDSEEEPDPFNESLEPIFKKGLNISIAASKQTDKANTSNNDDSLNKSNDTVKFDDCNDSNENSQDFKESRDSVTLSSYVEQNGAKSDSLNDTNNESNRLDSDYKSTKDDNDSALDEESFDDSPRVDEVVSNTNDDLTDVDTESPRDRVDEVSNINDDFTDVNRLTDANNDSVKVTDDIKELPNTIKNDSVTDTNEISDKLSHNFEINNQKTNLRGTYFVHESKMDDQLKLDVTIDKVEQKETLVSKIIKSLKSKSSDTSLRQFEQLEQATKHINESTDKMSESFGNINILKDKRNYFDENIQVTKDLETNFPIDKEIQKPKPEKMFIDEIKKEILNKTNSPKKNVQDNEFTIKNPLTDKRTYFDNIDTEQLQHKAINEIKNARNEDRSPSIVKDDINNDFEPTTIKQLLGESVNKVELLSSLTKHKVLGKKHDSVDIFEGDSPHKVNEDDKTNKLVREVSNVDAVRKSIEKLVLEQKTRSDIKIEIKSEPNSIEENDLANVTKPDQTVNETQRENTIDEFDNIVKNLSTQRATEFDLLVSQELEADKDFKENKTAEIKYNLRHKGKSIFNTSDDKKVKEKDEVLIESKAKCEAKALTTKRSLRLRRRKNQEEENSDQDSEKLKDILNLKKEFSDVTMGLPAPKKDVKDIPSPEKVIEDENLPPIMGIQSCPSKSVTRSRRKLFTPRAEPLEESLNQGDSNERVCVPRPSYHRARARRKL